MQLITAQSEYILALPVTSGKTWVSATDTVWKTQEVMMSVLDAVTTWQVTLFSQ